MKKMRIAFAVGLGLMMCLAFSGCGGQEPEKESADTEAQMDNQQIHVAVNGSDEKGDGSQENPYATLLAAGQNMNPGDEIIVHEGEYEPVEIFTTFSGLEDNPTIIRAAEGEQVVIKSEPGKVQSGEEGFKEAYGIHMMNVSNVTVRGFEIVGGTHGILYESTPEQGEEPIENVSIEQCVVHDVFGTHGIAVYAGNDLAPICGMTVLDNEVYNCKCGDSESLVLNGNIDGFTIAKNVIHDNNNIGIDMIGFEGTAKHAKGSDFDNPYDVDFVRNGLCYENVVYNISAEGNPAYFWDGDYDLCADGIYVDGGQQIEIYNNFVFNCDIGLEVATEHSPDKNELFKVSGIEVYDNIVAGCKGWCGLCFGGYDRDLGFTENCNFHNNTFVDNETQLGVQRSKGNTIEKNLFVSEDSSTIEFNGDCRQADLVNYVGENTWCIPAGNLKDYMDWGDFNLAALMPQVAMKNQTVVHNPDKVIDGFASKVPGVGCGYVPDKKYVKLYEEAK